MRCWCPFILPVRTARAPHKPRKGKEAEGWQRGKKRQPETPREYENKYIKDLRKGKTSPEQRQPKHPHYATKAPGDILEDVDLSNLDV